MINHSTMAPIAIGGVGGSGTRVVAQMLPYWDVYTGSFVNRTYDNTLFTQLFKSPSWLDQATSEEITARLRLFEKYMTRQRFTRKELQRVFRAAWNNETHPKFYRFSLQLLLEQLVRPSVSPQRWGWKEPNTHLFLCYLAEYFDDIRYIHVIRHGLDMAFTSNPQQLFYWGSRYNVTPPDPEDPSSLPRQQLDYWIAANRQAIQVGQQRLNDHFYLLNFDALCQYPVQELRQLFQFLEITVTRTFEEQLTELIRTPASQGRYKQHDLSRFSTSQLEAVQDLGYTIR